MKVMSLKKFDDEEQIVYGEVYAPNIPDAQGDFMTEREVKKMAHLFMTKMINDSIDTQHDNVENGSVLVESFVARDNDPDYLPGAWVAGVHVPDEGMWKRVKSGELNGFSFEGMVKGAETVIEIELPDDLKGLTSKAEGHDHTYVVEIDDEGNFLGGRTIEDDSGHIHTITKATVTDATDGHTHRFSFTDMLVTP